LVMTVRCACLWGSALLPKVETRLTTAQDRFGIFSSQSTVIRSQMSHESRLSTCKSYERSPKRDEGRCLMLASIVVHSVVEFDLETTAVTQSTCTVHVHVHAHAHVHDFVHRAQECPDTQCPCPWSLVPRDTKHDSSIWDIAETAVYSTVCNV
jgi:hypothetical protein